MNAIEQRLASVLSRHWWLLLLRGLAAIVFGVLAWVQPGISLAALVLLFGAYAMADGILASWTAITGAKGHDHQWVLLIHGLKDPYLLPGALNDTWKWVEKDLTLVTIPEAGHFVHRDAPALVTRRMLRWLTEEPGR